jgi:hypothetical protein
MLAGAMIVWFILTGASLLFVLIDFRNTPVSWVQKLAWGLVIAYTGPVGLFVYLLACRNPGPGLHDAFTKPMWKQAVNSEMHCLAGDATGIIIAAAVLSAFAMPWGWEVAIEYVAGYISGLLIFQAMMMRSMFASYGEAVKRTVFAETVSMNMVMVGMIPAMVLLAAQWPESDSPAHWSFWFRMGIAAVAGGLTAFPINQWLVARGYKHGCMTIPAKADSPNELDHEHMDHAAHEHGAMPNMGHPTEHQGHAMPKPSAGQQAFWIAATTAALAASVIVTALIR